MFLADNLLTKLQNLECQNQKTLDSIVTEVQNLVNIVNKQELILKEFTHELKTPLAILRSHWENEIAGSELPTELATKITKDIEELARLSHLVNQMNFLMRLETHELLLKTESLSMIGLILEVVELLSFLAEEKEQKIAFISSQDMLISGDKNQLFQAIFNLVQNALKYSPPHTQVEITTTLIDNHLKIAIKDHGIGIAKKDQEKIFDRFFRVNATEYAGSGLGLPLTLAIIQAHSGKIHVESQLNEGSTFTVELPLE